MYMSQLKYVHVTVNTESMFPDHVALVKQEDALGGVRSSVCVHLQRMTITGQKGVSGTRGPSQVRTDLTDPADGPNGSVRISRSAGSRYPSKSVYHSM